MAVAIFPGNTAVAGKLHRGRGNKSGQDSGVRVSKANHSLSAGIYAVDFAACPEILPRPSQLAVEEKGGRAVRSNINEQ